MKEESSSSNPKGNDMKIFYGLMALLVWLATITTVAAVGFIKIAMIMIGMLIGALLSSWFMSRIIRK